MKMSFFAWNKIHSQIEGNVIGFLLKIYFRHLESGLFCSLMFPHKPEKSSILHNIPIQIQEITYRKLYYKI